MRTESYPRRLHAKKPLTTNCLTLNALPALNSTVGPIRPFILPSPAKLEPRLRITARELGVEHTGITALYFADNQDWEIVWGEQPLNAASEPMDGGRVVEWQKSLQAQGAEASKALIADAEKRASADNPVTDAQRNYIRVAVMLEKLVEACLPVDL